MNLTGEDVAHSDLGRDVNEPALAVDDRRGGNADLGLHVVSENAPVDHEEVVGERLAEVTAAHVPQRSLGRGDAAGCRRRLECVDAVVRGSHHDHIDLAPLIGQVRHVQRLRIDLAVDLPVE